MSDGDLLEQVRKRIQARGARGILSLGKAFKQMDADSSGALDANEFANALKTYRISNDRLEMEAIFSRFDQDGNGEIDYAEFMLGVMGPMNSRRVAVTRAAFSALDSSRSGQVSLNDIRKRFNAKQHPDVLKGKQTEEDILFEFTDTFEAAYTLKHGESKSRTRAAGISDWLEYYQNLSASIDSDDYFELMVANTWGLNQ